MADTKTEEFIKKAREVHGDKYDYSKTVYVTSRDKVCITCPKHGDFYQTPNKHLMRRGCPLCANERRSINQRSNKEDFIEKANILYNGKYSYEKVEYINNSTKVCIICPEHGEFWQTPANHLSGFECYKCGIEKRVQTRQREGTYSDPNRIDKRIKEGLEPFLERVKIKYGENRFDLSNVEYKGRDNPVVLTCNECGITFESTPRLILKGFVRCDCNKIKKSEKDELLFKERLNQVHGEKFSYELISNRFEGLGSNISITCSLCGETFIRRAGDLLKLKGCPCCENKNGRITTEEFIRRAVEVHGNKYDYSLVEYVNLLTKVKIICPEHGIFEQTPGNHLYGYGCEKCAKEKNGKARALGKEEFILRAIAVHGDKYDYSEVEYSNRHTPVKIYCKKCDEFFFQAPQSHLSGCGCPSCAGKKKYTNESFIAKAKEVHGDKYIYDKVEITGIRNKVEIICPEHGSFFQTAFKHIMGQGCPHCNPQFSKGEKEIVEFIRSVYDGVVLENVRDVISPKELDIYIPDLKLAFEYNGLYYHSSKFQTSPSDARNKFMDCEKQGIRLITIYEDEWQNKNDLVKSMISRYIGGFDRIFARKTEVRKIEKPSEYGDFLEENHIQGKGSANFAYGLYYKNELVSVMTFTLPRENMGRDKEKDAGKIELSRFCNKKWTSVVGGASKLLKAFINSKEGKCFDEVYSYSDNRISHGDLYKSIGFRFDKDSSISYFYTDFKERRRKQAFRKSRLKEKGIDVEGKTEVELAEEMGWFKIYDCGKKLWILKTNRNEEG